MCTVSNIGDYAGKRWPQEYPWAQPYVDPGADPRFPPSYPLPGVSREEFERLKKEVEEMKKLLAAAQKFDEATDQPHCEHEEKVKMLKRFAELVGVDLKDVLS